MEQYDYENTLRLCYTVLRVVPDPDKVEAAIRLAEHSEAVGWIYDPTLYRANVDKLREDLTVMKAVAELGRLAERIKAGMK